MKKYFLFLVMFFATGFTSSIGNTTLKNNEYKDYTFKIIETRIKENRKIKLNPTEVMCMAQNIFYEAAKESTAGKIAVAQVTLNRVKSSKFPDTVCNVVKQGKHYKNGHPIRNKCHFSWYCNSVSDTPQEGISWTYSKTLAKKILKRYKKNEMIDITDGATHYYANYIEKPYWAIGMEKVTEIDKHLFYK